MSSAPANGITPGSPHIVCIDGMNFLHRARAGFTMGDYHVVFNAFRNLRALVEQLQPTRLVFVLEGHPKWRYDLMPEYKANRKIDVSPDGQAVDPANEKRLADLKNFFRQVPIITSALASVFPVSVVRHPDHECDDTIYNLIKRSSSAVPWTVVSNDSDFVQLLNEFEHVKLYNPHSKSYEQDPGYDYVVWKALRGDGSDNIPGIPGIGDETATQLVNDPDGLVRLFERADAASRFERNVELIKFRTWTDDEAMQMSSSDPIRDWEHVRKLFVEMGFNSLLKEKTWSKFVDTFDVLWGDHT